MRLKEGQPTMFARQKAGPCGVGETDISSTKEVQMQGRRGSYPHHCQYPWHMGAHFNTSQDLAGNRAYPSRSVWIFTGHQPFEVIGEHCAASRFRFFDNQDGRVSEVMHPTHQAKLQFEPPPDGFLPLKLYHMHVSKTIDRWRSHGMRTASQSCLQKRARQKACCKWCTAAKSK